MTRSGFHGWPFGQKRLRATHLGAGRLRPRRGPYRTIHEYHLRFDGQRGYFSSSARPQVGEKIRVRYLPNDTPGYRIARGDLKQVYNER